MTEEDFVDGEVIHLDLKKEIISNIVWRTKDYRLVRIGDMEDKHLRNIVLFLTNFSYNHCGASESVRLKWLQVFNIEWQRRMLERENKTRKFRAYPDRWDREFNKALNDDLDGMPTELLNGEADD